MEVSHLLCYFIAVVTSNGIIAAGMQGRRKPLDGQLMEYQELDGEEEGPERKRRGQVLANQG